MTRLILSLGLCLAVAAPAEAQIYSWRDAAGTLVLSNRPPSDASVDRTFAVSGGGTTRATRPAPPGTTRFDDLIDRHASAHGVSSDLVRAVIQVESAFNPHAVSPKGAQGLMQLMPATARELGVSDPFHPEQNIQGGVSYLRRLLDRYGQDVTLALAAYNAGPGAVERYGAVPPYRETQDYVARITATAPSAAPQMGAIYKWIEVVDGREIRRYSNVPPVGIPYQIVGRR